MKKLAIASSFLFLGLLGFVWLLARPDSGEQGPITLSGGPMIQIGDTDGRTGMVITWRTNIKSISRVNYLLASEEPSISTVADNSPTKYHAVVLTNLRPDALYHYHIFSNDRILAGGHFRTGKISGPFKLAVFGDSGSGREGQYAVARQIFSRKPNLILHTGDLIYSKGEDKDYWEKFYKPYEDLISNTLFMPSLGNHDYGTDNGQPWLDNFVLPGKKRYYSFDYANAHFVALDSIQVTEEETRWLAKDLAETQQTWKIVFFHYPILSNNKKHGDSNDLKNLWHPIFVKNKVDLVFSGHDHLYARFRPVDGVTYMIEGLGGKSRYETKDDSRIVATDCQHFGFGLVEINDRALIFRHFTDNGDVLDTATFNK